MNAKKYPAPVAAGNGGMPETIQAKNNSLQFHCQRFLLKAKKLVWSIALTSLQDHLYSEMQTDFDRNLSQQIDCITLLQEECCS